MTQLMVFKMTSFSLSTYYNTYLVYHCQYQIGRPQIEVQIRVPINKKYELAFSKKKSNQLVPFQKVTNRCGMLVRIFFCKNMIIT